MAHAKKKVFNGREYSLLVIEHSKKTADQEIKAYKSGKRLGGAYPYCRKVKSGNVWLVYGRKS